MTGEEVNKATAEVESVYRALDQLGLSRNCQGRTRCCRFKLTGRVPFLTLGEALVAARGVRASGKKQLPVGTGYSGAEQGECPLLGRNGSCTIYAHRPFGCRTHFCEAAGGNYPRAAVSALVRRLEEVAERLGDTDVRPLAGAVADALTLLPKRRTRMSR